MPEQYITVVTAIFHGINPEIRICGYVHFICLPVFIQSCIKRLIFKAVERILCKIIVTGTNIAVSQVFLRKPKTLDIIFDIEFPIEYEAHIVFVLQLEEHLFSVPENDRYIFDSSLQKLLYLPLDEFLTLHDKKAFRRVERKRNKPR